METGTRDGRPGSNDAGGTSAHTLTPDEMRLRSFVLDNCTDPIIAHTPHGTLLYANSAALKTWGCSHIDELTEQGPWAWVGERERPVITHHMARLMAHGELKHNASGPSGCGTPHDVEVHSRYLDTPEGGMVISVIRDLARRAQTEEMVRYLAYHDALTGLANRALFNHELALALSPSTERNGLVGLVYLDLNDFKPINDTLGHTNGDHVLRKISGRISSCVRLTDTVARVGGDEFVVLLPELRTEQGLKRVAEKLAEEIAKPIRIAGTDVSVTASVGTALYEPGESAESFVTRADHAMYASRKTPLATHMLGNT